MLKSLLTKLLSLILIILLLPTSLALATSAPPEGYDVEGEKVLHLFVLDLIGADCMLLEYQGKHLFIDTGKIGHIDRILQLVERRKVTKADVFITHPHDDHIGGLVPLTDHIEIGNIYGVFPDDEPDKSSWQKRVVKQLNEKGKKFIRLAHNDRIDFHEDIEIRVLQEPTNKNINERSGMLHITYGERKLLLTADVGNRTMGILGRQEGKAIQADILKAPHHGIENLQNDFLKAVQPNIVFFTHNKSKTKVMQDTLNRRKIPTVFVTEGLLHFLTDGGEEWYLEKLPRTNLDKTKKK